MVNDLWRLNINPFGLYGIEELHSLPALNSQTMGHVENSEALPDLPSTSPSLNEVASCYLLSVKKKKI